MIPVCTPEDEGAHDLLIEGPTVGGNFFIRTRCGDVWDGSEWRGFGPAAMFPTFMVAFATRKTARSKHPTNTAD